MTRTEYVLRLIGPLHPVPDRDGSAQSAWAGPAALSSHQSRVDRTEFGSTLFAGGGPAEPGGAGGARSMMRQP